MELEQDHILINENDKSDSKDFRDHEKNSYYSINFNGETRNICEMDKIIKKGWVYLWKGHENRYEKIWMILNDTQLIICKNRENLHLSIGFLNLKDIHLKNKDSFHFYIVKKYFFKVEIRVKREFELKTWVNLIKEAIDKLTTSDLCSIESKMNDRSVEYLNLIEKGIKELNKKYSEYSKYNTAIEENCSSLQTIFTNLLSITDRSDVEDNFEVVRKETSRFLLHALTIETTSRRFVQLIENQRMLWQKITGSTQTGDELLQDCSSLNTNSLETQIQESPIFDNQSQVISSFNNDEDTQKGFSSVNLQDLIMDDESLTCTRTVSVRIPSKEYYNQPYAHDSDLFQIEKLRRTSIIERNISFPFLNVFKNSYSKDCTTLNIPLCYLEPLTFLQYLNGMYEYSITLDKASQAIESDSQLALIAAFVVSTYSQDPHRHTMPFLPLLGETYECDRMMEFGWKSISECVSYEPLRIAHHCSGKEWILWCTITFYDGKITGRALEINYDGIFHLEMGDNHYTWSRVRRTMRNCFTKSVQVFYKGECVIKNHYKNEKCVLKFPTSAKNDKISFKVSGIIRDSYNVPKWILNGIYVKRLDGTPVLRNIGLDSSQLFQRLKTSILWENLTLFPNEKMYYFSQFECQLNEMEKDIAPSDSRFRMDIRSLEEGQYFEAIKYKQQLEASQKHKINTNNKIKLPNPIWFKLTYDPISRTSIPQFVGEYWKSRATQNWEHCPDLFEE